MDQIEKFLKKLDKKTALKIAQILTDIATLHIGSYDLEKLAGQKDLWRIRSGKIRIIFSKKDERGIPVYIEFRGKVYKKL
ncbi:hypothetical protein HYV44_01935 [Candidatus Microgenomates bacterium]|nr:hypothetical protein [Candidatus Microgenomates bacterium]